MPPCYFSIETERYQDCDGHWKCYCPHCVSCNETDYHLNKENVCQTCVKHIENKKNNVECFCFLCEMMVD